MQYMVHYNYIAGLEQDYVIRDENDGTIDKRVRYHYINHRVSYLIAIYHGAVVTG